MTKTLLLFSLIVVTTLTQAAFAESEPASCKPARLGKAHVLVDRLHWQQEKGSYKLVTEKACVVDAPLEIRSGNSNGCMGPVLTRCALTLDGQPHVLTVSGSAGFTEHGTKKKYFSLEYHLDRNSTEVRTGEASSTDVQLEDLSTQRIQMSLQSKLDSATPGMSTRDAVEITVNYEDTNAL